MSSSGQKSFVDTHFHVFAASLGIANARYVPHYEARLHDWMEQARRVGVTKGVLVQPSFLGADNSCMLNELLTRPDELRGVAVVQADIDATQLRSLHDGGVRGIRLNLAGRSHEIPEWSGARQLWDQLAALGWHLELHTDQGGLPRVLEQLPFSIPLVIDHMGKPANSEAADPTVLALLRRARQSRPGSTHVKLSGAYRLEGLDAATLARLWLEELGVASLLWGSDWPCTNHEERADYADLFSSLARWLPADSIGAILSDNPERVYWSVDHPGCRLGPATVKRRL